ncbi:MAG TPA: hypothetical protein VM940_15160 [Chthoniobacterales bacterium]|jgi:hypothetical protein|nr:hypothetical protein [Chthoniobacterales bacterium]
MVARGIAKQVLGTSVAVVAGWLVALLYVEVSGIIQLLQQPHYIVPEALLIGPIMAGVFMGYFIIPVWIFVLIPLYLFIPSSNSLWRWPICTACGALAGITIIAFTLGDFPPGPGKSFSAAWDFYIMAAIVGSVSCLVAACTRDRFKQPI